MTPRDALYQSLASCDAAWILFIGVGHEFVGAVLYPWGYGRFGGEIGWHVVGALTVGSGMLLLAGTLHFVRLPMSLPAAMGSLASSL